MFSYRHAFHAGNHADVLKHITLLETLSYLQQKETALHLIDTHAGAGLYSLQGDFARTSMEADDGIARLWSSKQRWPDPIENYLQAIEKFNPDGVLKNYPGSPALMWSSLRPQDRLNLFELHPSDQQLLQHNVRMLEQKKQVCVKISDGFNGLNALLPPSSRRGLVLMDPSYEIKADYQRVIEKINDALARFAHGVYMIWYPIVALTQAHQLPGKIQNIAQRAGRNWLHATLKVCNPDKDMRGLIASGMIVINPPFVLHDQLKKSLPILVKALGQGNGASYTLARS